MISDQYVWLTWASAFLVPWAALYLAFPLQRKTMLWASAFTAPFGLTEPLFVPAYWNPPSLFSLAQHTGFDLESLIFTFGIGGVAAVLYSVLTRRGARPMAAHEKRQSLHRHHYKALAAPFIAFPLLYFFPWNPIYPGIVAMTIGAVATMLCRPDLKTKTWIGGVLFLGYYIIFLLGLEWSAPATLRACGTSPRFPASCFSACRSRNCCGPSPSACTGPASTSTSPGGARRGANRFTRGPVTPQHHAPS